MKSRYYNEKIVKNGKIYLFPLDKSKKKGV